MACRVICISRTIAAGGESVGQLVASRLDFDYVDEQIIARAGQLAQVDPSLVAAVEQRTPLMDKLVEKIGAAQDVLAPIALGAFLPVGGALSGTPAGKAKPEEMRAFIRAAIHEVARRGQAVIVAHAASMALASAEGVLRVLVTASVATRARRLADSQGMTIADANAAVVRSDRNRRDYFRRFYEIRDEGPTHYDLVINTDVLSPEQAGDLIVFAART